MTKAGSPAKPIVFTGLRGMGKTALLQRCATDARAEGAVVIVGGSGAAFRRCHGT